MSVEQAKSRRGYRLQISNELARVSQMVNGTAEKNAAILKRVAGKVRIYQEKILVLDKAILAVITDDTALDTEVESQQTYEAHTLEQLLIIDELVESCKELSVSSSPSSDRSSGDQTSSTQKAKIKLPKLEIPSFSGDFLQWQGFWDIFRVTVHEDVTLSKIQKFSYLLGCLEGEALDMVLGFQLSEANYEEVLSVLTERYGDKQRTKFGHFEALVAVQPASLDVRDLLRVYYECERHIRSLVALGMSESEFAVAFIPIILAKLPQEIKRELWITNGEDEWTMANLRKYLKAAITARERSDAPFAGLSGNHEAGGARSKANGAHGKAVPSQKGSASMLVASSRQKAKNTRAKKCRYCELPHYSDQCLKVSDAEARKVYLREQNLCFSCLDGTHRTRDCPNQRPCYYCQRKGHHRSLCYDKFGRARNSSSTYKQRTSVASGNALLNPAAEAFVPKGASASIGSATTAVAVAKKDGKPVGCTSNANVAFMPTAVTTFTDVQCSRKSEGRLLMDTASSRTYVTEELCRKLQLPIVEEWHVAVGRFGSEKRKSSHTKRVKLRVECRDGPAQTVIANVIKVISAPVTRYPIDLDRFPVVRKLPMAEPLSDRPDELPIDALIGTDYFCRFVKLQAIMELQDGPDLIDSKFGFLTAGLMEIPENDKPESENTLVLLLTESAPGRDDPYDSYGIERFWQLEDVGTKAKANMVDISDEQALESFYSTLKFDQGRYWVTWPWKSPNPELADNKRLAFARLKGTHSRLSKDPKLLEAYDQIIQSQLEKNVVEVAPEAATGPVYYVPHHEVLTPSKTTTKIRVVYDASSKAKKSDLSLNDCLHRGPVILDDICGLLMRFRWFRIAIVADIEKAFLQVGLQESERDVGRFFWLKDIRKPLTVDNVVTYRFTRVFFGAVSSPSLLGATLDAHARKTEETSKDPVVKTMANQFRTNRYTDNVLGGADTVEQAVRHYQEAKKMCHTASMNLREFYTNSCEVSNQIAEVDRGQSASPKVLGVKWNLASDTLSCCGLKTAVVSGAEIPTKRRIVRSVAQVFDPCGWFTPVTMTGKKLIQDLWKMGISWDDPVDAEVSRKWDKVRQELLKIPQVEVPRYIGKKDAMYDLHVFCDASQKAAAAAVYCRKSVDGVTSCDLVFAKSRLAPMEPTQTIPRLELVAIELGVNLLSFVEKQLRLPIEKRVLWSDSQCALHWLRKPRLVSKFVQNRVDSILTHQSIERRYVPTSDNPADVPSRGCSVDNLAVNQVWWHGPHWLLWDAAYWPDIPFDMATEDAIVQEPETAMVNAAVEVVPELVIPLHKFSTLSKLLRVTATVRQACRKFRLPRGQKGKGGSGLSLAELTSAREYWDKLTQVRAFPESTSTNWKQWLRSSKISQLGVYKDAAGLLRCQGRLQHSQLGSYVQTPILLPKNDHYTKLVISQAHTVANHAGVAQTLATVRQMYWVIHGRSQVKKVTRDCLVCRRVEGGAYASPPQPALPAIRVTQKPPFAYTGLDYLGPLLIKPNEQSSQRQKVWICLFTCALTRAVHLEVVENQSAEEFHLALRRFFALFGTPLVLVSDNASQFRSVEDGMQKLLRSSEAVGDAASRYQVEWRRIPEVAPWMGGFYERMVGIVKKFLKKTLDGVCVHSSELRTVVAEIAFVVNSRPLLYVGDDTSSYSLCPNDFLGKPCRSGFPNYDESNAHLPQSTVGNVMASWKRLQKLSTQFWQMWKTAYLTSLREKYSNAVQRNPSLLVPSVNSVVQVKDKLPRGQWKLGCVEKLNTSHDGKIRSVLVRLANGRCITRPLRELFPIEIGSSDGRKPFDPPVVDAGVRGNAENASEDEFEGFSQGSVVDAENRVALFDGTVDIDGGSATGSTE